MKANNMLGNMVDYFVFKKMQYHCPLQYVLCVNCPNQIFEIMGSSIILFL